MVLEVSLGGGPRGESLRRSPKDVGRRSLRMLGGGPIGGTLRRSWGDP